MPGPNHNPPDCLMDLASEREALIGHHDLLRRLTDQLSTTIDSGGDPTVIAKHFDDFLSCLAVHFAAEERVMIALEYGGFGDHRQEHHDALTRLRLLDADYRDGRQAAAYEALHFIKSWNASHMEHRDAEFDLYLDQVKSRQ